MKWLVRLWLTFVAACTCAVIVGRLDDRLNTLQRLGFGICSGEACYMGITVGTDWKFARSLLPGVVEGDGSWMFPMYSDEIGFTPITIVNVDDKVQTIIFEQPSSRPDRYPLNVGTIIAFYGAPCLIELYHSDSGGGAMRITYPTLIIQVDTISSDPNDTTDFRLQPSAPIWNILLTRENAYGKCGDTAQFAGVWHGFTSANIYGARFKRALGSQKP